MSGYIFEFQSAPGGPAQFDPDGRIDPPIDVTAHNRALADAELARWAEKPDRQLAYFHFPEGTDVRVNRFAELRHRPYEVFVGGATRDQDAHVTIWPGDRIGTIVSARVYRHNLGGRFVSLRVRGSNGAMYYGRASWDNGTCVWLRRGK